MVTVSEPTPSTSHSSLSPATVAATPEGVPVMMMSPATQFHHFRQVGNDFRHVPDQLVEIAVLAQFAVALERDLALRRMSDLARRLERSARRRMVERLADFPRPLEVARGDLQVAAGEVDADRVAPDAIVRLGDRNVAAAALERDHQFDLVMHVLGERGVGHRTAVRHDGVGGLGEIERRQPLVLAHFADVLDIIAPDAPDAADRKHFVRAGDRDTRLRRRRNDVVRAHGNLPSGTFMGMRWPAGPSGIA